jgi:hypothetical protein
MIGPGGLLLVVLHVFGVLEFQKFYGCGLLLVVLQVFGVLEFQ